MRWPRATKSPPLSIVRVSSWYTAVGSTAHGYGGAASFRAAAYRWAAPHHSVSGPHALPSRFCSAAISRSSGAYHAKNSVESSGA